MQPSLQGTGCTGCTGPAVPDPPNPTPESPLPSVCRLQRLFRSLTQLRARKACTQREPRAPLPPYTSTRRASPEAAILLLTGATLNAKSKSSPLLSATQRGTHEGCPTHRSLPVPRPQALPRGGDGDTAEPRPPLRPIRAWHPEHVTRLCPAYPPGPRPRYIKSRLPAAARFSTVPRPPVPPPPTVSQSERSYLGACSKLFPSHLPRPLL